MHDHSQRDEHGATLAELRTVEDHREAVAALLTHTERIDVPLQAAIGRVLAVDVTSSISLPPFDNSAMDGYAVRQSEIAEALVTAAVTLPVSRDIPAGAGDVGPLEPGTAARIMTGAPVPDGADFVVPVEFTDGGISQVTITGPVGDRPHIRLAGDDVRAGTTVLTAGMTVGAAQIGVAAAIGHATLPVFRALTVLVLSTGSELAAPGTPLAPGQIYESNGQMLAAAVTEAGAEARLAHFVSDDVTEFFAMLRAHMAGVDLILTSGGVSAGAYEVVKDAFTNAGVTFTKVAMQPGMPQGAGKYDGIPVVTLPGNPVSSFVSFEVFVRPAIRAAMGFINARRPAVRLRLTESLISPLGKRQLRRGTIDAALGTVTPIGGSGSHLLGALAYADCLFVVPESVEHLESGAPVEVWLLSE
ncbi:MAG: gephyrin-like molybdotransferase Glp [Nakamurella sp.]